MDVSSANGQVFSPISDKMERTVEYTMALLMLVVIEFALGEVRLMWSLG